MARRKFSLTTTEAAELKAAYHQSKDGDYNKKLLAVRLYGTGYPTASIMELVGCSRTSLMEWVQSYQCELADAMHQYFAANCASDLRQNVPVCGLQLNTPVVIKPPL